MLLVIGEWNARIREAIANKNMYYFDHKLIPEQESSHAVLNGCLKDLKLPKVSKSEKNQILMLWRCLKTGKYKVKYGGNGEGPLLKVGAIIELPEGTFWPGSLQQRKLYVRQCYNHIVYHIMCSGDKDTSFGISGAAGIGKTYLFGYVLFILAWCNVSTVLVQTLDTKQWLIDGDVVYYINPNNIAQKKISTYVPFYLADGNIKIVESVFIDKEGVLMHFCSYQKDIFYEAFQKPHIGADIIYMALWTLEELRDCCRKVYDDLKDDILKERFNMFGGKIRSILSTKEEWAIIGDSFLF